MTPPCFPEITNATFRRDCHRSGKGAWTTLEQLRFLLLPARCRPRSLVRVPRSVQNLLSSASVFDSSGNGDPQPARSAGGAPPPRRLALGTAFPGRYGGQGGIPAGCRRRVFGVCRGDRKMDGGGNANGEEPRVGTISGPRPDRACEHMSRERLLVTIISPALSFSG